MASLKSSEVQVIVVFLVIVLIMHEMYVKNKVSGPNLCQPLFYGGVPGSGPYF